MKFKFYDIVSHLIPGFIIYVSYLEVKEKAFDNDFVVPATAIAFLIGYFVNTIGSWLESFFNWSWGGKPSNRLLQGKDIPKVRFYSSEEAKELLLKESKNGEASDDELFSIAKRYATHEINSRVLDFNSNYAFSRVILTTSLIAMGLLAFDYYQSLEYYLIGLPILFISWVRCKQRGYYYAKEVLDTYLKQKRVH